MRIVRTLLLVTCLGCAAGSEPATDTPATRARARTGAEAPARGASAPAGSAAAGGVADTSSGPVTPASRGSLGKVPVLMVHVLGEPEGLWTITPARFRRALQVLHDSGYRPITVSQLIDRRIDVPPGRRPVVFTFDDASPSQFRYIERNGQLEIDPNSAVGIWLAFGAAHPEWRARATFCTLSGAEAGRSFFGNRGIEGQQDAWRFRKLQFLVAQGFELCNHTLWHAQLSKYPDSVVQEQIARGQLAIDSAVPGYRVRTFALPLGVWPRTRSLAWQGAWRDPKTGIEHRYQYDAVLEVAGGPSVSPFDGTFNPRSIRRYNVYGESVAQLVARLARDSAGYVAR